MNFREIAETIFAASPADQTEVVAVEQDESLTRFANNTIHQNVTERNTQVTVRAVIGTRVGIAVSNDLRTESLRNLARQAVELAKLQPENPEFKGLPDPKPIPSAQAFDENTALCSPAGRAERVATICRKAASAGYTAAGSLTTGAAHWGVANTRGIFAEFQSTLADVSTVIMGSSSSGWAQSTASSVSRINTEELADEAIRKVSMGADPRECEAGEYTVVLEPYAAGNLIEMLAFDGMGALAFQEERSWLNGRIGQRIMAESVTIVDDGLDPAALPAPFDFEGLPRNQIAIVQAGVAQGPVYDSFTASREAGKESTGHATFPSPTERYGPIPSNLFLRPGNETTESMIRSIKRGIYVTRFWYTVPVHPRDVVVTGMTRDGTFVIEDGEIAYPIKSLRFTQSYLSALNQTQSIGSTSKILRFGSGAVSVPALKLDGFRFTSSTR